MSDGTHPPLALHLFGPFGADQHGHPLPRTRTRKGQWLLALLALRPGEALERDWLAGTLWPASRHPVALANLRAALQDLRRVLGAEAPRLLTPTRRTLAFDFAGASVDVLEFDAAITRDEPAALHSAVALYRGPLLEQCAEEWVFPERQIREQAYLGALERLTVHARGRGDRAAAESYLRRAAAVDPHRESTQRELMQVLAEGGNYAAALQLYRDLRLRLNRELNTAPDPSTTALFEQLRTQAQRAGAPKADQSRWPRRPGRLPIPPTRLLGRERELDFLKNVLIGQRARLATLTGPGGIGKTRLALEAALAAQDQFENGAFLIDLAPVRDPGLIVSTIAGRLGIEERRSRPVRETLKEYLPNRRLLLLLDNFEHLLAAAPLVAELLAEAPALKLLVTSRARLHLRGEKLLVVPPLALPPLVEGRRWGADGPREPGTGSRVPPPSGTNPHPSTIGQYAAVRLFVERASDVRPEFALTDENAGAVAEICHRLDGIPLAIELAAARVRLMAPSSLLRRLERRLSLLTDGPRDLPARQQTLRNTIEWSYSLLSEGEQQLLRRLSVFVDGFTLESAEAVGGEQWAVGSSVGDGSAPPTAGLPAPRRSLPADFLEGISALLDQSLLRPLAASLPSEDGVQLARADDEARFDMLETIREFAQEQLEASGEQSAVRRQHARYFLHWAESIDRTGWGRGDSRWLDRAEQENNNMRAALTWAIESGTSLEEQEAAELGLRLAAALSPFWSSRGHQKEGREWLRRLMALPGTSRQTPVWARAFERFGDHVWELGENQEGLRLAEESLALWRKIGDRAGIARALYSVGWRHHIFDRHEPARRHFEESLALFRELEDREGVARLLNGLGGLAYRTGDMDAASRFAQQAVDLYRELGDRRGMGGTMGNVALYAACRNDHETALRVSWEWLGIVQELHDTRLMILAHHRLGMSSFALGDIDNAREYWERGLAILRRQEDPTNPSFLLNCLGGLACFQGEWERARDLFKEARVWAEQQSREDVSRISHLAGATMGLAGVACGEGDLETARARYRDTIELWRQLKENAGLPQFGPRLPIARGLHGLAKVALKNGEAERAARWFGAATAARETLDINLPVPEAREWERCVEQVRGLLGEEAFASAWDQGAAMPLDEAVAEAIGDDCLA